MFDVVVIGSGPGGYVAAIRAAQLGLKVACIDKNKELGGTCLNIGCIPSKTLLSSSEFYAKIMHDATLHGIEVGNLTYDFPAMMKRKEDVVKGFNQGIKALFQKNNITTIVGEAKIMGPNKVQVAGDPIEAKNIIIATGSEPIALPFLPFDEKRIISSTGALSLQRPPERLIVIGAGVIGVELGSVYSRLGSKVEFIEFMDRICPTFDESLSKELQKSLEKQGMIFKLSTKVTGADINAKSITIRTNGGDFEADTVLVAIGRRPYTKNLGIETDEKGFVPIDGQFRTKIPSVYAIGDVVDGPMLAHKASEEGVAVAEIIAGQNPTLDYVCIPNVIYTAPEVASVGLTESEALKLGMKIKTGSFPFKANSRAKCVMEDTGFIKIIADEPTDKILGVQIIGAHASELIATAVLALRNRLTLSNLAETPFAHPTFSEALKESALTALRRPIHK
jgi:dihydrolipoamide dehydrogenase